MSELAPCMVQMTTSGDDRELDAMFGLVQVMNHCTLNNHQRQAVLGYLLERSRRDAYREGISEGTLLQTAPNAGFGAQLAHRGIK